VAVAGDAEEDREIILGAALGNRASEGAPFRDFAGTITPNATREFCLRTGRMLKGGFGRYAIGARASVAGLAIIRFKESEMQKAILMLRDMRFMAILNCACALCTWVAQPSVLALCLAAVWQAKPLITSTSKRSLEF
jgi:hypothetical protein